MASRASPVDYEDGVPKPEELPHAQTCAFYEAYSYPLGYNIDLNVSCGEGAVSLKGAGSAAHEGRLGLHASRAFTEGETIAWVPENAHIWEPTILWPIRHAVAEACEPRAYAESVLAVALLTERRNPDSRFKHYVATLARVTLPELRNIATFTTDQLHVVNVTRPDLVALFESVMRCIEGSESKIKLLQTDPVTQGERLWAYGIVKSRSVKLRGRLALVPIVDLANHGLPPTAELDVRGTKNSAILRSRVDLAGGDEVTLDYGHKATNMELLATHGFVVSNNPSGMLLPFDFNTVFSPDGSDGGDGGSTPRRWPGAEDQPEPPECTEALRWPQLWKDAPMLLDTISGICLEERLMRYYKMHYTEIDVIDEHHVQLKALELIGNLCNNILQGYRKHAGIINRLRQHGQRAQDWAAMQVTHEAVDDMRFLETCVGAAKKHKDAYEARRRDDL